MQACMAPPEYDAVQIRKKYSLRPLAVTSRTIQIVGLLGSFGFEVRHPPMHVYARAPIPPTVRCVRHTVLSAPTQRRTLTTTCSVGCVWDRCWGTS